MTPSATAIDLRLERHTLDNGLRVVLHPDPSLPLAAVNLWYHVGSKNEAPGRTGLAHLFEHMLFQGSAHVGTNDHFRYVQQVGGVLNGSTWYDRTNYYETLPAHHLGLGLWLESDRMGHFLPALTAEKLENQREVVMNERRQRVDNQPYGRAFERLHELLYPPGHPYRWPVIGTMDDIAAASLVDVAEFFRRHYVPNNAVLTIAGDFEPAAARREVERFFGDIPPGPPPAPVTVPPAEAPRSGRREVLEDDVQLPRVHLGFLVPPYGSRSWYAADLLAAVLSGGRSSPLYQDLVYRRQIAREVSAFVFPTELAATFFVVATGRPGVSPEELEEALAAHLRRAAVEIPGEQLERARSRVLTAFYSELQTVDRRADLLCQLATYFDAPERLCHEVGRYLELAPADLVALAREHLGAEGAAAVVVVPRGSAG